MVRSVQVRYVRRSALTYKEDERLHAPASPFTELLQLQAEVLLVRCPVALHEDEAEYLHCWSDYGHPVEGCFEDDDQACLQVGEVE